MNSPILSYLTKRAFRSSYHHSKPFPHPRQFTESLPRHSSRQAIPIGGFYETLLEYPLPTYATTKVTKSESNQPSDPPTTSPISESSSTPKPLSDLEAARQLTAQRAASVFGTSKNTSKFRRQPPSASSPSIVINGITIPPRPKEPEPDDCCMSGCVNCVWEGYRDELEDWSRVKKGAEMKGAGKNQLKGAEEEELFGDVPIGMREFMMQEKRLKERRIKEGLGNVST